MLPPELARLVRLHRGRQQLLAHQATQAAIRAWASLDPDNLDSSWPQVADRLLRMVIAHQIEAAQGAQEYVTTTVDLQGATSAPAGTIPASAYGGWASDGRSLNTLLDTPMWGVKTLVDGGAATADALGIGLHHLTRIVTTQIQDATRISAGVAGVNDRATTGYVRIAAPPSCARCAVLAGKTYRYNTGFLRHPQCDCINVPNTGRLRPSSPREIYDGMDPTARSRAGWSAADQRAIADGADIAQVTNARRAMRTVTVAGRPVQTTLVGTSRRAVAGSRLSTGPGSRVTRLTPEQIYSESSRLGWSRDETIRQLFRHGYIL